MPVGTINRRISQISYQSETKYRKLIVRRLFNQNESESCHYVYVLACCAGIMLKRPPCNSDPIMSQFYIVKLSCTGVHIIIFFTFVIRHG